MSRQTLDSVAMSLRPDFEKAYFDSAISGNAKPLIDFANSHADFFMNNYGIDVYKLFKIDQNLINKIESFQLKPVANPFQEQKVPETNDIDYSQIIKIGGIGLMVIGSLLILKNIIKK